MKLEKGKMASVYASPEGPKSGLRHKLWGVRRGEGGLWEVVRFEGGGRVTVMDEGYRTAHEATERRGEMQAAEQGVPFEGVYTQWNQRMLDQAEEALRSGRPFKRGKK
jgi:hypothetical protein